MATPEEDELEDIGIPPVEGAPPGRGDNDLEEGIVPPRDYSQGVEEYGTTAAEERMGESVAVRESRYEPEVGELPSDDAADRDPSLDWAEVGAEGIDHPDRVGRLVGSDIDVGVLDDETNEVAVDMGDDGGGYSAEEAAMHVTDEP